MRHHQIEPAPQNLRPRFGWHLSPRLHGVVGRRNSFCRAGRVDRRNLGDNLTRSWVRHCKPIR